MPGPTDYRKKPVVIQAWLWDETKETFQSLEEHGMRMASHGGHINRPGWVSNLRIVTLEGAMSADIGDYIIRGVKGEFYPCKPDVFSMSYETPAPPDLTGELVAALRELVDTVGARSDRYYEFTLERARAVLAKLPEANPKETT